MEPQVAQQKSKEKHTRAESHTGGTLWAFTECRRGSPGTAEEQRPTCSHGSRWGDTTSGREEGQQAVCTGTAPLPGGAPLSPTPPPAPESSPTGSHVTPQRHHLPAPTLLHVPLRVQGAPRRVLLCAWGLIHDQAVSVSPSHVHACNSVCFTGTRGPCTSVGVASLHGLTHRYTAAS